MAPIISKELNMKYILRMPLEMRREIFKFIDIETRIDMLLQTHPYLVRGPNRLDEDTLNAEGNNPFHSLSGGLFNYEQYVNIYVKGFIKQLFVEHNGRWSLKSSILKFLPSNPIHAYSSRDAYNINATRTNMGFKHPIHALFVNFRKKCEFGGNQIYVRWNDVTNVPINALSLLLTTNSFDANIDYNLRKIGWRFLIAIDRFIKTVKHKKHIDWLKREERRLMVLEDQSSNIERKKQAKLAKVQAREQAKQAKVQARERAKQAKVQEREQAKQAKVQEREQAKQAKVQAKEQAKVQAKEQAKQAKVQEREQAKLAKVQAKEQAKLAMIQDREQPKLAMIQDREQPKLAMIQVMEQPKQQSQLSFIHRAHQVISNVLLLGGLQNAH